MRTKTRGTKWLLAGVLILPLLALTLVAQQSSTLVVNGQRGEARVVQVDGRNYVEVEALARLTNGSLRFNGNQIVLSLPGTGEAPASVAPAATGFTKEFLAAAIESMSQAREWHAALKNAMERGYPLSEDWIGPFRRQTQQAVRLAAVAANSEADKNLAALLNNVFNTMNNLSDKYLQMTKNMNYFAPNSLDTDPIDQRLRACGHSLSNMAGSNQFIDDGTCH